MKAVSGSSQPNSISFFAGLSAAKQAWPSALAARNAPRKAIHGRVRNAFMTISSCGVPRSAFSLSWQRQIFQLDGEEHRPRLHRNIPGEFRRLADLHRAGTIVG
jgi:hypothetical protein